MKGLIIVSLVCFMLLSIQAGFVFGKHDVTYALRNPLMFRGGDIDVWRARSFRTTEERWSAIRGLETERDKILKERKDRGRFSTRHWYENFNKSLDSLRIAISRDERTFSNGYNELFNMIEWVNSRYERCKNGEHTLETMPRVGNLFMRFILSGNIGLSDDPLDAASFENFKRTALYPNGQIKDNYLSDFRNFMEDNIKPTPRITSGGRIVTAVKNKWLASFGKDADKEALEAVNLVLAYEKRKASQVVKAAPSVEESVSSMTDEEIKERLVVAMFNNPELHDRIRVVLNRKNIIGSGVINAILAYIQTQGEISSIADLQEIGRETKKFSLPDGKLPLIVNALLEDPELVATIGEIGESLGSNTAIRRAI